MMRAASGAVCALVLSLLPLHAASAQDPPSRGWLGVGVQELMECRVQGVQRDRCVGVWKRLVVTQVVVGGPADRAGVQVGDTLIALDGDRLDRGLAEPAFAAIRPGTAVRLQLGRDGRRTTLRLVPAERPTGPVAMRVPGAAGEMQVVRRPLAPPPPPAVEGAGEGRRFVIRGRSGVYQIHPQVEISVEGREGEERVGLIVQLGTEEAEAARRAAGRGRAPGYVARGGNRYVQLDPGPELRALQDSVFLTARHRLDSLYRALRGNGGHLRELVRQMRVERPGRLVFTGVFGRSVAGAEFEPLSRELAEFFQGPEDGLLCLRVASDTPADRLGLRPGDVVVEVAGDAVASLDELRAAFHRVEARPIEVKWVRKGRPMQGVLRYE